LLGCRVALALAIHPKKLEVRKSTAHATKVLMRTTVLVDISKNVFPGEVEQSSPPAELEQGLCMDEP